MSAKVKILKINTNIYKAIGQDIGPIITDYSKKIGKKKCNYKTITWFGKLNVAKKYKTKSNKIYRYNTIKNTRLLQIDSHNKQIIKDKILNYRYPSKYEVLYRGNKLKKYDHPYLDMDTRNRCLYEIFFAYGFMTLDEQYEFINLILYLIDTKKSSIKHPKSATYTKALYNTPRAYVLFFVKFWHKIAGKLGTKKYNKINIYEINKHSAYNICLAFNDIDGIFYPNKESSWYPFSMIPTFEYIIFKPHLTIKYTGEYQK